MENILKYALGFLYSAVFCMVVLSGYQLLILFYFLATKFFFDFIIFVVIALFLTPLFVKHLQ